MPVIQLLFLLSFALCWSRQGQSTYVHHFLDCHPAHADGFYQKELDVSSEPDRTDSSCLRLTAIHLRDGQF